MVYCLMLQGLTFDAVEILSYCTKILRCSSSTRDWYVLWRVRITRTLHTYEVNHTEKIKIRCYAADLFTYITLLNAGDI